MSEQEFGFTQSALGGLIIAGTLDIVFLVVQSALGELKFVPVDAGQDVETWSDITHTGDTWTDVSASGTTESWTSITHSGDTWADVDASTDAETWTEVVN